MAANVDADNVEDMLFGLACPPESFQDATNYASEDEMLDDPDDDENILWDLQDSPRLKPVITDYQGGEYIDHDNAMSRLPEINEPTFAQTTQPSRDRYVSQLMACVSFSSHRRDWVIARIEAMLERIVDGLLEDSEALTITLKSRAALSRRRIVVANGDGRVPEPKERDLNFPGATAQEAWNFTVLLQILELIHAGLIDNTVMTKRDIYYRHPNLFVKQSVVDRYVDDLACTFGISRAQLNVTAAAKGLVAGNFSIIREDGYRVDGLKDAEGLLVPKVGENDFLDLTSVQWVLVIEKEVSLMRRW
jgi:meiotic recombination protein SPO11